MLHIGIGRRDRFCVHGGVAVILPMLQMVYEIERQIGEQRLQLAGDADGFLGERGAVFLEPLRGLGALFRRPVENLRADPGGRTPAMSSSRRCLRS